MSEQPGTVWPILHYDDPNAGVRFLVDVVGFEAVVVAEDDDGDVVHAELRWPGGGALVVGGTKHAGGVHGHLPTGVAATYVVTADVDEVHRRLLDAGAEVDRAPHETQFGSGVTARATTARDPEGNVWTFATYVG